ncbi:putative inactive ATP-dependent zinc metalloprotease FTSHI 1 [Cucumis melo var. makuwa]|uniref:Inactive ATP-dependent zinc metalloprotease FTSHI 1 n=2 Tax=Cucumis melo TaxID=3656 RepID=A0A5D3D254_CUCMM|nr:putative inactive ATP-dependent zinc metalloprotease FTSHI 1 [Cucumis melo var. makuwa]TYK16579.1 putative inactive ATP-dependent zinc metalloprotease FTSHI 1 [Cucumis melo var. makuwa]
MASTDSLLSPRAFLPNSSFNPLTPRLNHLQTLRFNFTRNPRTPFLFLHRNRFSFCLAVSNSSDSPSQSSGGDKAARDDFVTRVLKENPSQLEPRKKSKEEGIEGRNEGGNKSEAVYLKDILREYKGKLYVPELVFNTELSEEEEFDRSFEALPKMSLKDFVEAMEGDKEFLQGIDFSRSSSKAEAHVDGSTGVEFSDVAGPGIDEAVEELQEDFNLIFTPYPCAFAGNKSSHVWDLSCLGSRYLTNPEVLDKVGIKPPHGVLSKGPPGCGKTLVAKAIAGEAGVPFYQMAGSVLVEVVVGVVSARTRDLFNQFSMLSLCRSVIFMDEIHALTARRQGIFKESMDNLYIAATQERETTLNQLLIELDGFDTGRGVVFLAATNKRDLLDPLLLRPGRFDRKIKIHPPGAKERLDLLKIHASKVKISNSVDLSIYSQNLLGWLGAMLAQLVQEAALIAVRKGHESIVLSEMDDAVDRLTVGPRRIGIELGHQGQYRRATTEMGVAITSHLLRR